MNTRIYDLDIIPRILDTNNRAKITFESRLYQAHQVIVLRYMNNN